LLLEIVGHDDSEFTPVRADAYGIPAEHALRGFRSVTMWVKQREPTEQALVETLGLRQVRDEGATRRYAIPNAAYARFIDVRAVGEFPNGVQSAGTVHHVALRVADRAAQLRVRQRVQAAGLEPTPVIDRTYFESVYFREPGGVLFELATDPPGFAVDERPDRLGERLMLPERYAGQRAQIEAVLPPIHLPVSEPAELG
jgi:glyoxalase family protein